MIINMLPTLSFSFYDLSSPHEPRHLMFRTEVFILSNKRFTHLNFRVDISLYLSRLLVFRFPAYDLFSKLVTGKDQHNAAMLTPFSEGVPYPPWGVWGVAWRRTGKPGLSGPHIASPSGCRGSPLHGGIGGLDLRQRQTHEQFRRKTSFFFFFFLR